MTWIVLALVCLAAILDLRSRQIPDAIPIAIFAVGILGLILGLDERQWLSSSLLFLGVFGGGCVLFVTGGLGGGDVKLITSLSIAFPIATFVTACFFAAIAGGAHALVARIRGEKEIAYGLAIAVGFVAAVLVPGAFPGQLGGGP